MAEELTFHLEDFDGPLELLLALVAKHKMDLHNIPILQLIEYDQCRRMAALLRAKGETAPVFVRRPMEMESSSKSTIGSASQILKVFTILLLYPTIGISNGTAFTA